MVPSTLLSSSFDPVAERAQKPASRLLADLFEDQEHQRFQSLCELESKLDNCFRGRRVTE